MNYLLKYIIERIKNFFIKIWDFIFFFFRMPYEEQAKNWTGMRRMPRLEVQRTQRLKRHITEQIK